MDVKTLKELIQSIPDDYEIISCSENRFGLNSMDEIETIKIIDIHKTVVLIRGHE